MQLDQFELQIAKVRDRFTATLEQKIRDAISSAPQLTGEGAAVVERVAQSYRMLHGISGIGSTIGFPSTGRLARTAESALTQAYREKRALSEGEVSCLAQALETLHGAVLAELQAARSGS